MHAVTLHRSLQGTDGIDLGDDHLGTLRLERLGTAFADVAVATNDSDFAGDHDVGRALDAIDQRLAAAVEVVELRLRDRVVHVDGRDAELPFLRHLVKAVHARGGLLRDALPILEVVRPLDRVFSIDLLQERLDDTFLFAACRSVNPGTVALFEIGRTFTPGEEKTEEPRTLAIALTGNRNAAFWTGDDREAKLDIFDPCP